MSVEYFTFSEKDQGYVGHDLRHVPVTFQEARLQVFNVHFSLAQM